MVNETRYIGTVPDNVSTSGTWGGWYPTITEPAPTAVVSSITISGYGEPERDENMWSLFRITVVNPKTELIYESFLVVAKDRESALLKASLPSGVRDNPDDYDFCVECVGDVRAKKDIQKVEVVEGEKGS